MNMIRPWVGHRGMGCTDHDFYQDKRDIKNLPVENTIESFEGAYRQGAAACELDVCMTADGKLFILHNTVPADHFFGDGNIPPDFLNKLNWSELQHYKTGRYQNGKIALLEDVLDLVAGRTAGELPYAVNIELKHLAGSDQNYTDGGFIDHVAKLVKASRVPVEQICFSAFSENLTIQLSHLLPQAQYGLLFREYKDGDETNPVKAAIYADHQDSPLYQSHPFSRAGIDLQLSMWKQHAAKDARVTFVHPEIRTITADMMDYVAGQNLRINTWARFEGPDDWDDLYLAARTMADERQIPIIFISDYADKMNRLNIE